MFRRLQSIVRRAFRVLRCSKKLQTGLLVVLLLGLCTATSTASPQPSSLTAQLAAPSTFDIALIGDLGYNPAEESQFATLMQDLDRANIEFIVHDGDFKNGVFPCTDQVFQDRLAGFQQSRHPFIYTPGDNEWTDCHRAGSDPLERLAKLRTLFFATGTSLGQTTIPLERQSAAFPENARWTRGNVLFATLHVVGSNNNLGRTPEMDKEFTARNAANIEWLKSSFQMAKQRNLAGVMVIMQADMMFEAPANKRTGFNNTIAVLQAETEAFQKPVVLVHGDSHYFKIDKVLVDRQNQRLLKFTRVETFGTPDAHWVKATIDANSANVFEFSPVLVPENLAP
ncbi:MAG TPA: hypothetical protein V6D19_19550 [Stenomitos sp.]